MPLSKPISMKKNSKYIFLDRDGVINRKIENGYVTSWDNFVFLPRVFDALELFCKNGYALIVVSNQAGVAKGLMSLEDLQRIDAFMKTEVVKKGSVILASYYCPHRDEDLCSCRKPKSGLFKKAIDDNNLDVNNTQNMWIIGDSERDIIAGSDVGCRGILITPFNDKKTLAERCVNDLYTAAQVIIK